MIRTLHYPFIKNILVCLLAALGVTAFAQATIYINPSATVSNPNGSLASPYTDFNDAIVAAEAGGGGDVLIVGGTHVIANPITITAAATAVTAVTIKPVPGEAVTFEVTGRAGFDFANTAAYLTLEGVELYGTTDQLDFWCVVGQSFWGDETIPRGGGLAVILDG